MLGNMREPQRNWSPKIINHRFKLIFVVYICHEILTFTSVTNASRVAKVTAEISCDNIRMQSMYSLSDMNGHWYGVEILEHVNKGRPSAESCIKIEFRYRNSNYIDLIWRERNFQVDYTFVILDQNQRGNWTSQGQQSVTGKPGNYRYEHFAGNVFILKASDANIVLTFCSAPHKLYTLVLSKSRAMNETELSDIHSMVQRFGLPAPVDIKKFCRNSSIVTRPTFLFVAFSTVVLQISFYSFYT